MLARSLATYEDCQLHDYGLQYLIFVLVVWLKSFSRYVVYHWVGSLPMFNGHGTEGLFRKRPKRAYLATGRTCNAVLNSF